MVFHGSCLNFRSLSAKCRNPKTRTNLYNLNLFVLTLAVISFLVFKYEMSKITYRHPYLLQTLSDQTELLHGWLSNMTTDTLQVECPAVTVHYLWCRKGHFEFKHYLSVLSIMKSFQPDQIVFHYTELPTTDRKGYVTWFEDIQRDVPLLMFKKISHSQYCGHSFFEQMDFELADYDNPAGVFVTDDVAVLNFTRKDFIDLAWSSKSHSNVRVFLFPSTEPYLIREKNGVKLIKCPPIQEYNQSPSKQGPCVQLTERLSPPDIWSRKESFYTFARSLVYGTQNLKPLEDESSLVPLHCHILHFTDSAQFDFVAFSSVMSALYVGKMTRVYVHSDRVPLGPLYEKIITQHNVTFVQVPHVRRFHPELGDIVYGAYVLLRHGGVVVRSDTIWRKEMTRDLQAYDSIATLRRSVYRIINYSLDLTVLISKTNSEFLRLLLGTLRQTPKRHSEANNEEVAYRVYLETPQSVRLDSSLIQHVSCSQDLCQPLPEDLGSGWSFLVQMTWKNGRPKTETDFKQYRGVGVDLIKTLKPLGH